MTVRSWSVRRPAADAVGRAWQRLAAWQAADAMFLVFNRNFPFRLLLGMEMLRLPREIRIAVAAGELQLVSDLSLDSQKIVLRYDGARRAAPPVPPGFPEPAEPAALVGSRQA